MFLTRLPLPLRGVRLACVKPAASVRSEPGSNSQVEGSASFQRFDRDWSLTISVLSRAAKNLLTSPKHTGPRSASRRRRPDGLDPNVTVKVLSQPRNPSRRTNRKTRKDPAVHVSFSSDAIVKQRRCQIHGIQSFPSEKPSISNPPRKKEPHTQRHCVQALVYNQKAQIPQKQREQNSAVARGQRRRR